MGAGRGVGSAVSDVICILAYGGFMLLGAVTFIVGLLYYYSIAASTPGEPRDVLKGCRGEEHTHAHRQPDTQPDTHARAQRERESERERERERERDGPMAGPPSTVTQNFVP